MAAAVYEREICIADIGRSKKKNDNPICQLLCFFIPNKKLHFICKMVIISDFKKAKTETDPAKLFFFKMTGVPRHRKHFRVAMMTWLLAILLPTTASRLAINAFDHLRNKTKSKIYFSFTRARTITIGAVRLLPVTPTLRYLLRR